MGFHQEYLEDPWGLLEPLRRLKNNHNSGVLGSMDPWVLKEYLEDPWGILGDPWGSSGILGDPWGPLGCYYEFLLVNYVNNWNY